MSLWKYSFELITRELDLVTKKKQALNELFESKRISQSTYEYLEKDLTEALNDLQMHFDTLKGKMTARAAELEKQVGTLELFLASAEIHHASGDIDGESYKAQTESIVLGLETTKQELSDIRKALPTNGTEPVKNTETLMPTENVEKPEVIIATSDISESPMPMAIINES